MMKNIITEKLEKLKDKLVSFSKETKFIKRKVKLTAHNFLASLLSSNKTNSDEMICNNLQEDYGVDIKRQSYNERLHKDESVAYLKKIFEHLLAENSIEETEEMRGITESFNNIFVEDNSTISLHESMSEKFKGVGGSANTSAMKIYLNYIANKRQIADIQIESGTKNDTKFANIVIDILKKGDLVLRDLGFFQIDSFIKIKEKLAYFLSRLKMNTTIYIGDKKMDLFEYIESKGDFTILDEDVEITAQKLTVRLTVYKVSEEVYNERVRKLKKSYAKSGKTPSKRLLKLQKYVMFVSNIDREMVSKEQIGTLYRLRWQVELVFKRWKSFMHIAVITSTSKKSEDVANKKGGKISNRILCFIYAKLISILLMTTIELVAHLLAIHECRELSSDKFVKWILLRDRLQKLFIGGDSVEDFLVLLQSNIMRLLKDKRIQNPSTLVLLNDGIGFYEEMGMLGRLEG
jgi:hypothetical protein